MAILQSQQTILKEVSLNEITAHAKKRVELVLVLDTLGNYLHIELLYHRHCTFNGDMRLFALETFPDYFLFKLDEPERQAEKICHI